MTALDTARGRGREGGLLIVVIALISAVLTTSAARGASYNLYYATGTMGAPAQSSGVSVIPTQAVGVRFQVAADISVNGVGGHFAKDNNGGNNPIFAAIIRLSGFSDYPDSFDLSTPDLVAQTTFLTPTPSNDVIAPIGPVTLSPGIYGLLFGTNLFGASGYAYMPLNNPQVGSPSYFWRDSTPKWRNGNDGFSSGERMTIYVPEPATAAITAPLAFLLALAARRHRFTIS